MTSETGEHQAGDRLARVVVAQDSPTPRQYMQLARYVKARMEAGQSKEDAFAAVFDQAETIVMGILAENPDSSREGSMIYAVRAYFKAHHPGTLLRERGAPLPDWIP